MTVKRPCMAQKCREKQSSTQNGNEKPFVTQNDHVNTMLLTKWQWKTLCGQNDRKKSCLTQNNKEKTMRGPNWPRKDNVWTKITKKRRNSAQNYRETIRSPKWPCKHHAWHKMTKKKPFVAKNDREKTMLDPKWPWKAMLGPNAFCYTNVLCNFIQRRPSLLELLLSKNWYLLTLSLTIAL